MVCKMLVNLPVGLTNQPPVGKVDNAVGLSCKFVIWVTMSIV